MHLSKNLKKQQQSNDSQGSSRRTFHTFSKLFFGKFPLKSALCFEQQQPPLRFHESG